MLAYLIYMFTKLTTAETRGTALDNYITARQPANLADVERYVKQFDRENGGRWW